MPENNHPDDPIQNRRKFLKKVATTSTVGFTAAVGSSATVSASTIERTEKPEQKEAEDIFFKYATDLLTLLSNEGLLEDGSVSELPLDKPTDFRTVSSKSSEGIAFATWDGDRSDEYRTVTNLEDGVLSIAIQPTKDHAYAFYEPYDTDKTYIAKAGYGMADVGTSDHSCNTDCSCVSKCGGWSADQKCCVLYPCETDTTCSWNIYCDAC